jgi:phosphoribosylformylglycinamidine cyclo-ligase
MAHISGGGLLNVARLAADVSYELDTLPAAPEVFGVIAERGQVGPETMYATFNMGIGFCVVVADSDVQPALEALKKAGEDAVRIGHVTEKPGKSVSIPSQNLTGTGDTFTVHIA